MRSFFRGKTPESRTFYAKKVNIMAVEKTVETVQNLAITSFLRVTVPLFFVMPGNIF